MNSDKPYDYESEDDIFDIPEPAGLPNDELMYRRRQILNVDWLTDCGITEPVLLEVDEELKDEVWRPFC